MKKYFELKKEEGEIILCVSNQKNSLNDDADIYTSLIKEFTDATGYKTEELCEATYSINAKTKKEVNDSIKKNLKDWKKTEFTGSDETSDSNWAFINWDTDKNFHDLGLPTYVKFDEKFDLTKINSIIKTQYGYGAKDVVWI